MKLYIMVFALVAGLGGCGISKQIEKSIDFGVRATLVPRIAISKFLVESTASIYELNAVQQAKPVFIQSLNAHFYDSKHAFDLNFDSIAATIFKDTIVFSQFSFPLRSQYLQSDTIDVKVTCSYLLPDSLAHPVEGCLSGNYIIYRDSIIQKDKYRPCTF